LSTLAVTGGSGFIGSYVARELEHRGIPFVLLMRESSRAPTFVSADRIVRLSSFENVHEVHDLAGRPDTLIHLAWGGLPNYGSRHHFEAELPSQARFLFELVDAGLQHLVVAGTCFEYGMRNGALHEHMRADPANYYALAKDSLRRQLLFLQAERRFALTWPRIFYTWGEGQAASSLWSSLAAAQARGDVEFPMSGGEQLRDYLHVSAVARLLVDLAIRGRDHGIVNACSGRPVAVRTLVEEWIREHGWRIKPSFGRLPYPSHEPLAFWGDPSKLNRIVN
jgi:nucleoside-diphosphate-sugar epimerase